MDWPSDDSLATNRAVPEMTFGQSEEGGDGAAVGRLTKDRRNCRGWRGSGRTPHLPWARAGPFGSIARSMGRAQGWTVAHSRRYLV